VFWGAYFSLESNYSTICENRWPFVTSVISNTGALIVFFHAAVLQASSSGTIQRTV